MIPDNPGLCFQVIDLVKKVKFNIQCIDAADKTRWQRVMEACASNSATASLTLEEQLEREKEARVKLQEKNASLWKRIRELEKELEEESNLRRSLQDQLKNKN